MFLRLIHSQSLSVQGGTVYGGESEVSTHRFAPRRMCVVGSAADIGYTHDSSQRHAQANIVEDGVAGSDADTCYTQHHTQANTVVEKSNEAWRAPPIVGATLTFPRVPDPGGTAKREDAPEPGGAPKL